MFTVTTTTASSSSPTAGKYTGPPLPTGGLSDKLLDAIAKAALPPPELSIGELLLWMQTTMEKTDTAIREKMNAMVADQGLTKKYTDAISALDKMGKYATDIGGEVPLTKEFWDAMDGTELPENVRTVMGKGGEVGTFLGDAGTDGTVGLGAINALKDALKDAITAKNSSHEMQMIQLQSDVSSRQQKFQMVSAMAHSLDETASQIISKF